ncbi:DUF7261 family protein [Haloplanus salilacus]|uniref:DUF7261 family protein n=1 Tax=Haloplanus salilacus TaxID=2949994 RepID=UPI0030D5C969
MTRRRGQLVLLAAAVVVTALVPMLLAYAQLGYAGDAASTPDARTTLTDAERSLERSVGDATTALSNRTDGGRHALLADLVVDRLAPARERIESSGTDRGHAVAVVRNTTAATRWAERACPRGEAREFGDCVVTDGVVTQTRADTTALVAVAVDVRVRGPDGTAETTLVIRGVRGTVGVSARSTPE